MDDNPDTITVSVHGRGLDMKVETRTSDPLASDLLQLLADRLRQLPTEPEQEDAAT